VKEPNHFLRSLKLPALINHRCPKAEIENGKVVWVYEIRKVIASAVDTHGAIVRRKQYSRYYAPIEELYPLLPP